MNSKSSPLPEEDYRCTDFEGVNICINTNAPSPFKETRDVYIMKENLMEDHHLYPDNMCHNDGVECFVQSIRGASKIVFLFLIATIVSYSLHEVFHFTAFVIGGETPSGFVFSITGGTTYLNNIDVLQHSIWWWFICVMGPLIFTNALIIILVSLLYPSDKPYDKVYYGVSKQTRYLEVFLKSMGYVSAVTILSNTVLSPLFEYVYAFFGTNARSDLTMIWRISYYYPSDTIFAEGSLLRFVIVLTVGILCFVSLYYFYGYSKHGLNDRES